MKVAWLAPLAAESAIAAVTVAVAEEMRRLGVDLDLWSSDPGETLSVDVPVVRYAVGEAFEHALREYDAVLYSIGDSLTFHRDVLTMARRVPGTIVLHDMVVHHMVVGWYFQVAAGIPRYLDAIEHWYGADVRERAAASFTNADGTWRAIENVPHFWDSDLVVSYPMFEDTLFKATGVVVHSEFLRALVSAKTDLPVLHLPLPAVPHVAREAAQRTQPSSIALDVPDDRVVLLTVGNLNPNKRILEVIDVLGRHPDLAARVVYVVVGSQQNAIHTQQIQDAIARHGLESVVRVLGRCPDGELRAWLTRADVCLTLRHPVMEGASLSIVEQMSAGKAVIVTNAGVYAETPDDTVRKIDPGAEAAQLPDVLRALVDDPDMRRTLGAAARAHADALHRADRYASALAAFVRDTGDITAMARYTDRVGLALRQLGIAPDMPIVDRIVSETTNLFGDPQTSPWRINDSRSRF